MRLRSGRLLALCVLSVTTLLLLSTGQAAASGVRGAKPAAAAVRSGPPSGSELMAKLKRCNQISHGAYPDAGNGPFVVCGAKGAVFFKADMDIDCDGIPDAKCNSNTDCCFQPDTYCHTSGDQPLQSSRLPYVVIPNSSRIWDYRKFGIDCGTVIAVIFNNKVEYAVMGDTGPPDLIGEASYATAVDLGIDPDPMTGGVSSGVSYIVFQNSNASPIEDHAQAVRQGQVLARQFVNNN
jgi:hypothetical protein